MTSCFNYTWTSGEMTAKLQVLSKASKVCKMVSAWEADQIDTLHVPTHALVCTVLHFKKPKEPGKPFVALVGHSIFQPSGLSKHYTFMIALSSLDVCKPSVDTRMLHFSCRAKLQYCIYLTFHVLPGNYVYQCD